MTDEVVGPDALGHADLAVLSARFPVEAGPGGGDRVPSTEAGQLGAQLDEHHVPETNGRMPVCRRCGVQTDNPEGRQHIPNERLLARAVQWLDAQSRCTTLTA